MIPAIPALRCARWLVLLRTVVWLSRPSISLLVVVVAAASSSWPGHRRAFQSTEFPGISDRHLP
jgi:hypothetical protein